MDCSLSSSAMVQSKVNDDILSESKTLLALFNSITGMVMSRMDFCEVRTDKHRRVHQSIH